MWVSMERKQLLLLFFVGVRIDGRESYENLISPKIRIRGRQTMAEPGNRETMEYDR